MNYTPPKIPRKEETKVKKTLCLLIKILADSKIQYRIFGSILPAALLGRPQRKLGDIDLMVDENGKNILFDKLEKEDYTVQERRFGLSGFNSPWAVAIKKYHLEVTIFLGQFDKEGNFNIFVSRNLKIVAKASSIKPTPYDLFNLRFIGIPKTTAFYGALKSKGNPKRKYDLTVFQLKKIEKPPIGYPVIDFYYKERRLHFLYSVFCFLQDFLGRTNVALGRNYDFWKDE